MNTIASTVSAQAGKTVLLLIQAFLKTGYYRNAGFSMAATAARDGKRVIVVVLGSRTRAHRDRIAAAMLERGFAWMSR